MTATITRQKDTLAGSLNIYDGDDHLVIQKHTSYPAWDCETLLSGMAISIGVRLDPNVCTLGFARRATPYKRFDLLFQNLDRLHHIHETVGPLQIIMAGKAHPRDDGGREQIRRVFAATTSLGNRPQVVYLEGYDMAL